ncbi:MAG: hypothetical protein IJN65_05810 [Clostridia bacterium]|nr:hypothetical protein [Clostridia bacterium]
MKFYLFLLVCFWAASVAFSFLLGKGKIRLKKPPKKPIPQDSLHIKRIKEMEKQFWHYNGMPTDKN